MLGASNCAAATGRCTVCCHFVCLAVAQLRGTCIQIVEYLSQAPHILQRGGLNQAHPAPWGTAVPRGTRELPFSSSCCEQPDIRALMRGSCLVSQEEFVQAPVHLPTDFARAELCLQGAWAVTKWELRAAIQRGVSLNTRLPPLGSGGRGSPLPGPSGDAGEARAERTACCRETLLAGRRSVWERQGERAWNEGCGGRLTASSGSFWRACASTRWAWGKRPRSEGTAGTLLDCAAAAASSAPCLQPLPWFISTDVLSSSVILIEWGLWAARGSCGEEDRGWGCPSSEGTGVPSPWCPSRSLLLLPTHRWVSCAERSAHSHGVRCLTQGIGHLRLFSLKITMRKASLEASLLIALSGRAACLPPCLCGPLSTVSCAASFPNLQISCFQASLLPLWGPSFKYAPFRNPSDSLFSLS